MSTTQRRDQRSFDNEAKQMARRQQSLGVGVLPMQSLSRFDPEQQSEARGQSSTSEKTHTAIK